MEAPDTIATVIRISLVVMIGLILPQVASFIAYIYSLKKKPIYRKLSILIAPVMFFVIAYIVWNMWAGSIRSEGRYVCGAFGAAALFSTIFGTLINLILSILISLITYYIWKRKQRGIQCQQVNSTVNEYNQNK